jgi:NAD-dependent deacetylase
MYMRSLDIESYRNIVFLTGAGISAASGLRTYRGPDGLWNDEARKRLSEAETFAREPLEVWKFWSETRRISRGASPNAAHLAIVELARRLRPDQSLTVVTTNIDGLHARAGGLRVVEFHGTVHRTRCSSAACALEPYEDASSHTESVPLCPLCGSMLRPDIVLFHEAIPKRAYEDSFSAIEACDLFIAVGTTLSVFPAFSLADEAREGGARCVYVNLERQADRFAFAEEYIGRAEEILPRFLAPGDREATGECVYGDFPEMECEHDQE